MQKFIEDYGLIIVAVVIVAAMVVFGSVFKGAISNAISNAVTKVTGAGDNAMKTTLMMF